MENKIKEKKKICMLATVHYPPFNIRVFHKEAKSLAEAGYDVTIIAQYHKNEIVKGIKIVGVPKAPNRLYRMTITSIQALIKAIKERAHIYHLHSPEQLPLGMVLKIIGKKVIYDVHEDFPKDFLTKEWIPKLLRKLTSLTFKIFQCFSIQFIDFIISATPSIAKSFPASKNVTITNFPFLELTNSVKRSKNERRDTFNLIYAGDLSRERGIYELIQSLEFIDKKVNAKMLLIGKFCNKDFEEKIKILSRNTKVKIVPWVPFDEVIKFYGDSDVGVIVFHPIPNHLEAIPNKLFEYMAVGLPVVASNFPLWKEIIEGNHCGIIVNPLDPKDIARGINFLLLNPNLIKKMGENGRRAVIERFNWEREKEKLLNLYKTIFLTIT